MTTGVTCTVYVDGERAADGSPGDDLTSPVILEDLAVAWGRADTMSQPDPDTCTFDVMDAAGGEAFIQTYRTGRRIDIIATGETYPDPTIPTFQNPGFETAAVTWAPTAATATRSTAQAHTGANSLAVKPTTAGTPGSVLLAPGPFQPAGTNPDAWDEIPATSIGQTWSGSIAILAPVGASATVRPVRFSGPYVDAVTVLPAIQTVVGSGAWQVVTFEATSSLDGSWIGVQVMIDPTGPAWDQMPPTLTWDGVDPTLMWDELGTVYVDDVIVLAPGTGTGRSVLVFSGRITDLTAGWDDTVGGPVVKVTAVGFTADLQNRTIIGDVPWDVESVDERTHRILELAGLPITIDIADTLDVTLLTYRDVDAQGAHGLLQEIATSVDGVLWPAVHRTIGAYLELEDPSQRASLLQLHADPPIPATLLRTNQFTNPDAVALTGTVPTYFGTAGTSPTLHTITQIDGAPLAARKAARYTRNATGVARVPVGMSLPVSTVHTVRMTVQTSYAVTMTLAYRVALANTTNTVTIGSYTFLPGVPQDIVGTFTTLATAPSSPGFLWTPSVGVVGDTTDITKVTVERSATSPGAFSGATPDTPTRVYDWTAAADASTSTETQPPVAQPIVIVEANPDEGFDLSACQVLRDPVQWTQTVSDVVTRVAAGWLVQGVDDDGLPTTTDATVEVVDAPAEALYGTRRVQVSTQLQDATDATDVASRILARTSATDWRADGLTLDDDEIPAGLIGVALLLDLLDGTSRIGAPIVLGDLPVWSPSGDVVGVYLEGGTYRYVAGRWVLELIVSAAAGQGQSAQWDQLDPAWTWDQWDQDITWNALRGVAAP